MSLLRLNAGSLTTTFDPESGFLRYIVVDTAEGLRQEIVRGIFAAVRDRNWDTIPFSIDDLKVERSHDSFSVRFHAISRHSSVRFRWRGEIEGNVNSVRYCFRGQVLEAFQRNRIGLCVLHPSGECAGRPCRVEHVDGSITRGKFPDFISPHQPFKDIRSITQVVSPGMEARVTMTGDTFEMEDQRNWTDASFKTYCTPLEIPFPITVAAGEVIEQEVVIELVRGTDRGRNRGTGCATTKTRRAQIQWEQPVQRPGVGFLLPQLRAAPDAKVIARLRELRPDHLRVDLRLGKSSWRNDFTQARLLAESIECELEIALFAENSTDGNWQDCIRLLSERAEIVARVLLFHSDEKTTHQSLIQDSASSLSRIAPDLSLAVGTDAYFAELNRGRPQLSTGMLVCYSINPQVHAFDNLSLAETLEAQRDTVDSAVEVFGTDVVVSPITLRPRFNPNATVKLDMAKELHAAIDPRQASGFGAAWTAGVFSSLATHPRVESMTVYEAFGPRGIIDGHGDDYPMTELFRRVCRGRNLFPVTTDQPQQLIAIVVATEDDSPDASATLVLGNMSEEECIVEVIDPNEVGQMLSVAVPPESIQFVPVEVPSDA